MEKPILSVVCHEPEGEIIHNIYDLNFSTETLDKFTNKALKFPTLYGREVKTIEDVTSIFFDVTPISVKPRGIFYVVDDFVGVFYITDFRYDFSDALVHYTFFDRRHKGRVPLVRAMLKYIFDQFNFQRVSVELPLYMSGESVQRSKTGVMNFIRLCGFSHEGRRRKAIQYKGEWFDMNLYGITKAEVLNGSTK